MASRRKITKIIIIISAISAEQRITVFNSLNKRLSIQVITLLHVKLLPWCIMHAFMINFCENKFYEF